MKQILVALGPQAEHVLDRATQIAGQHCASLTLVHVGARETGAAGGDVLARAEASLRERGLPDDLQVDFRAAFGEPAPEIARVARQLGPDLVVFGAHEENAIADMFFESTAFYTLEEGCETPFLIVRDPVQGPYSRVLAPTDFSPCSKRALRAAIMLAPQARFNALHVYDLPFSTFLHLSEDQLEHYRREHASRIERDVREEMSEFLARRGDHPLPEVRVLVEHDDVNAGIENVAGWLKPDLLAMGMSGRGFAVLFGGRTNEFLKRAPCDLLITP